MSAELEPLREAAPESGNAYVFWRRSSVEEKRAFLTRTVRQIELQTDHVQIVFRRGDAAIRVPLRTGKRTPAADQLDSFLGIGDRGSEADDEELS